MSKNRLSVNAIKKALEKDKEILSFDLKSSSDLSAMRDMLGYISTKTDNLMVISADKLMASGSIGTPFDSTPSVTYEFDGSNQVLAPAQYTQIFGNGYDTMFDFVHNFNINIEDLLYLQGVIRIVDDRNGRYIDKGHYTVVHKDNNWIRVRFTKPPVSAKIVITKY